MEPRSCDRGKEGGVPRAPYLPPLQWSRDHVIAESTRTQESQRGANWLQWSRDHVIAERRNSAKRRTISAMLQWSRDHVIAESDLLGDSVIGDISFNGAAIV